MARLKPWKSLISNKLENRMAYNRKLIDVALPLEDVNREAAREKSIRHRQPSMLRLRWAERMVSGRDIANR